MHQHPSMHPHILRRMVPTRAFWFWAAGWFDQHDQPCPSSTQLPGDATQGKAASLDLLRSGHWPDLCSAEHRRNKQSLAVPGPVKETAPRSLSLPLHWVPSVLGPSGDTYTGCLVWQVWCSLASELGTATASAERLQSNFCAGQGVREPVCHSYTSTQGPAPVTLSTAPAQTHTQLERESIAFNFFLIFPG